MVKILWGWIMKMGGLGAGPSFFQEGTENASVESSSPIKGAVGMYTVDHLLKRHQEDLRRLRKTSATSWRRRRREHKAMLESFKSRLGELGMPRTDPRFPAVRKLFGAMAAAVVAGLVILVG